MRGEKKTEMERLVLYGIVRPKNKHKQSNRVHVENGKVGSIYELQLKMTFICKHYFLLRGFIVCCL